MRELMEQSAGRADTDFLVQGADAAKPLTAQRGSHVDDVRYTFGEHDRLARVLAGSLARLGVARGDRVRVGLGQCARVGAHVVACAILARRSCR